MNSDENRTIHTQGGDYAEGNIDKRQTIHGDLNIYYGGYPVSGGAIPLPRLEAVYPPDPGEMVGREHELARYHKQILDEHLAVITGMPGVGKTTLAAVLARQCTSLDRIFWHTFHEGEGIDVIIWKIAGFLAHHQQDTLWQLLQSSRQLGTQPPLPHLLFDYLIQAITGQNYLLCFDDLQFVEHDPLFDQFARLLRARVVAGDVTLIVTSRQLPSVIQAADTVPLQGLSDTDFHALLAQRGIVLSSALSTNLYAHTEGNAQLLMLSIDALQRTADPTRLLARLTEADHIERYLLEELDSGLSDAERAVMSAIAVLMRYPGTRDAIEAIVDQSHVRRTLSDLISRYLLMITEGHEDREYGQHAMVQAFYYGLLGRRERQSLHLRAANYYETDGQDVLKAARHFVQIGEHAHAAQLVLPAAETLINRGQARALLLFFQELQKALSTPQLQLQIQEACGDMSYLFGELNTAAQAFEKAFQLSSLSSASNQVRLLRKLGDVAMRKSENQVALGYLDQGLALLANTDSAPIEHALLSVGHSTLQIALGQYDRAAEEARDALEQIVADHTPRIAADLYDVIGKVSFFKGQLSASLAQFHSALMLRMNGDDQQGIIKSYSNLAVVYGEQNQYTKALEANQSALAIAERLGDSVALVMLHSNIAADSIYQGAYEDAIQSLSTSILLSERMGNLYGLALAHRNLGDVYRRMEQVDLATQHLNTALTLARQIDHKEEAVGALQTLAEVCLAQKQYPEALAHCQESMLMITELDNQLHQPFSLDLMGRIYHATHQWDEARAAFRNAEQIWRMRESWGDLVSTLINWARLELDSAELHAAREHALDAQGILTQHNDTYLEQQVGDLLQDIDMAGLPAKG